MVLPLNKVLEDYRFDTFSNEFQADVVQRWTKEALLVNPDLTKEEKIELIEVAKSKLRERQSRRDPSVPPRQDDPEIQAHIDEYLRYPKAMKMAGRFGTSLDAWNALAFAERMGGKIGIADLRKAAKAYQAYDIIRTYDKGFGLEKAADIAGAIPRTLFEFAASPGTKLKAAKGLWGLLTAGAINASTKFAAHELMRLPTAEESELSLKDYLVHRTKLMGGEAVTGAVFGAAGQLLPGTLHSLVTFPGAFAGYEYLKTGDLNAAIEGGVSLFGFGLAGVVEQGFAGKRNRSLLVKAIKEAKERSPALRKLSDQDVLRIAKETITFRKLADAPEKIAVALSEKLKGKGIGEVVKTIDERLGNDAFFQGVSAALRTHMEFEAISKETAKRNQGIAEKLTPSMVTALKKKMVDLGDSSVEIKNLRKHKLVDKLFATHSMDEVRKIFSGDEFIITELTPAKLPGKESESLAREKALAELTGVSTKASVVKPQELKVGKKWATLELPKTEEGLKGRYSTVKSKEGFEVDYQDLGKGLKRVVRIKLPKEWAEARKNEVLGKILGGKGDISSLSESSAWYSWSELERSMERESGSKIADFMQKFSTPEGVFLVHDDPAKIAVFHNLYAAVTKATAERLAKSKTVEEMIPALRDVHDVVEDLIVGKKATVPDFGGVYPGASTRGVIFHVGGARNRYYINPWSFLEDAAAYQAQIKATSTPDLSKLSSLDRSKVFKDAAQRMTSTIVHEQAHVLEWDHSKSHTEKTLLGLTRLIASGKEKVITQLIQDAYKRLDYSSLIKEINDVQREHREASKLSREERISRAVGRAGVEGELEGAGKFVSESRRAPGLIEERRPSGGTEASRKRERRISDFLDKEILKVEDSPLVPQRKSRKEVSQELTKEIETLRKETQGIDRPKTFANALKNWAFTWTRTSEEKLRSFGEGGEKLADELRFYADNKVMQTSRTNYLIREAEKGLSAADNVALGRVLNGEMKAPSRKIAAAAETHRTLYKVFYRLAKSIGAMTRTAEGEFVPVREVKNFMARYLKPEIRSALLSSKGSYYDQAINHIVEGRLRKRGVITKGMNRAQVEDRVKSASQDRLVAAELLLKQVGVSRMGDNGHIERERVVDLPADFYETNASKVMHWYSIDFWDWYYKRQLIGYPKAARAQTEKEQVITKTLDMIRSEKGELAYESAVKIKNDALGLSETQSKRMLEAILRPIREINTIGLIGLNIPLMIKQLTQTMTVIGRYGYIEAIRATSDILGGRFRKVREKSGVYGTEPAARLTMGESSRITKKVSKVTLAGFKMTDNVGRGLGAKMATNRAEALLWIGREGKAKLGWRLRGIGKDPDEIRKMALNDLQYLGLKNAEEAMKRGKFTPGELRLIAKRGGDDPFFQVGPLDLPQGWAASPILKTLLQFTSFGWKQAHYVGKEFVAKDFYEHRNPIPLLRLLTGGVLTGELAIWLENLMTGDERVETTIPRRILADLFYVGTLGMVERAFAGNPSRWFTGPTGDLIIDLIGKTTAVAKGDKTPREVGEALLQRRVSGIGFMKKVVRSKAEASYESFTRRVRNAARQGKSGGLERILGVGSGLRSQSAFWNAASRGARSPIGYEDFSAEAERKEKEGVNVNRSVSSLIKRRNPRVLYLSLSREEREIFKETYGDVDFTPLLIYWRENSARLREYARKYRAESRHKSAS